MRLSIGRNGSIKGAALFHVLLLACMVSSFVLTSYAAEKKNKVPEKGKKPPIQLCHGPLMDISPDGELIVSIGQDFPVLNLLDMSDQKRNQFTLPKKPYDVVAIGDDKAVVSYGPWGELAIVDMKQGVVNKPFKIGESADSMCKTSNGLVIVADSETNNIYLVDPNTQSKLKTFALQSKPAGMRWIVPDLQIEVIGTKDQSLGKFKLPQQEHSQTIR